MLKHVQPQVNMNPNAGLRNSTYFHLFTYEILIKAATDLKFSREKKLFKWEKTHLYDLKTLF